MTVTRGNKSANSTPKKVAKSPKSTPKKTPVKKAATPKSTPKKAATPKSTPKKAATPKSTPKKAATPKSTPKKAATPKKANGAASEEVAEEASEEVTVTPAASASSTPKAKKTSAKSTPVKATKKASTSKTSTPVKASKVATPKTPKQAANTKATPKRKAADATASPAKKAKSGVPEGAIKKPIPSDMVVQDHETKEWNLHELVQKHGLVIFAYPAASTPGCTKQVCFFRDSFTTFADKGFKVFGLSNDSSKKNATFYTKQNLNYPLISDPNGKLISFLGIGKDASHKAQRSAFVIPQGGEFLYSNVPVGPEPSKDWALSIVQGL